MRLRVAGAQIPVVREIAANLSALHRAMDFALAEKADVLLTPEGSLSGYTPRFDTEEAGRALEEVTARAGRAGLGLALGTCFVEPESRRRFNQIRFYDVDGRYVGFHSKLLRCGTLEDPPRGEVQDYAEKPLEVFRLKNVPVGGLICNDLWANPGCTPMPDSHLTQQLARLGARIVLHAVNGGRDGSEFSKVNWAFHDSNLRMRAQAGRLWIVTVDNCHPPHIPCSAPSGVIDPGGNWLVQAPPQGEHFFAATIDLSDTPKTG
ncbi:MAG: carbon-nitrogen hydrolase family protein [Planctomycetes bacterium]|nr:carbon-nitrogen hydrolase family protein [Planctomycetota bacterium]